MAPGRSQLRTHDSRALSSHSPAPLLLSRFDPNQHPGSPNRRPPASARLPSGCKPLNVNTGGREAAAPGASCRVRVKVRIWGDSPQAAPKDPDARQGRRKSQGSGQTVRGSQDGVPLEPGPREGLCGVHAAPRARPQGPQRTMPPVGEVAPGGEGPPLQHVQGLSARRTGLWQVRRSPNSPVCSPSSVLSAGYDHSRPTAAWWGHVCGVSWATHSPSSRVTGGLWGVSSPQPHPTASSRKKEEVGTAWRL